MLQEFFTQHGCRLKEAGWLHLKIIKLSITTDWQFARFGLQKKNTGYNFESLEKSEVCLKVLINY